MADDEVFNVTALCEIADIDDVAKAVCAVNDALASTKIGLDTFFLIFGVSPRRNFLLLTFGGMNPLLRGVMDDLLAWIVCVRFVIADCYSLFGRDFPLSDGQPHGPQRRLVSITRAAEWPLAFTRDKCMVARTRRRLTSGTVGFSMAGSVQPWYLVCYNTTHLICSTTSWKNCCVQSSQTLGGTLSGPGFRLLRDASFWPPSRSITCDALLLLFIYI